MILLLLVRYKLLAYNSLVNVGEVSRDSSVCICFLASQLRFAVQANQPNEVITPPQRLITRTQYTQYFIPN